MERRVKLKASAKNEIYFVPSGSNPKQKNSDGFTPRLLAKEKSFKDASKELRKAERTFTKFSKPGMKNPNEPEVLYLYDWVCERSDLIKELLMKMVSNFGFNCNFFAKTGLNIQATLKKLFFCHK